MGKARLAAAAVLATAALATAAPAADAAPGCTLTGGVLQLPYLQANVSIVGTGDLQVYDTSDPLSTLCTYAPDEVSSIVVTPPDGVNPHLTVMVNPPITHSDGTSIPIDWRLSRRATGTFDIFVAPWNHVGAVAWQAGPPAATRNGAPPPPGTFTPEHPPTATPDPRGPEP